MKLAVAVVLVVVAVLGRCKTDDKPRPEANVTVNFDHHGLPVLDGAISGTISTYGEAGNAIARPGGAEVKANLADLDLGYCRVPIQWNGGNPISSAGGGPRDVSGAAWVDAIREAGCEPLIVVGGSDDNNWTPLEAGALAAAFPDVGRWVLGNEPSGGVTAAYCDKFGAASDAMKAANPAVKVGGPALAWYDLTSLENFLRDDDCGGKADLVDWHNYAMGEGAQSTETAMALTDTWGLQVQRIRAMAMQYGRDVEVMIGEINWSWRTGNGYGGSCDPTVTYPGDERFFCPEAMAWSAAVFGGIVTQGGRAHQYADLNGGLGIVFEKPSEATMFGRPLNSPMPIYWGLYAFKGFGTTNVETSTTLDGVEVFASTSPNVVVLVNKSPVGKDTTVQLMRNQYTHAVAEQNTGPFSPPVVVYDADQEHSQRLVELHLPGYSVTTLRLT